MKKMGVTGEDLTKPTRRLLFLTAAFHSVSLANLLVNTPRWAREWTRASAGARDRL